MEEQGGDSAFPLWGGPGFSDPGPSGFPRWPLGLDISGEKGLTFGPNHPLTLGWIKIMKSVY